MLAVSTVALGQSDDRRRFESDVFNKGRLVQSQVDLALWRAGSFYATPVFGVRNLGYDENVFSTEEVEQDDFTASPEVGLQTYLRLGPRWVWANRAVYGYLYHADLDDLSGSQYGGESRLHGVFRRAYFDLGYVYRKDRRRSTSEIDDRVESEQGELEWNAAFQPSARGFIELKGALKTLRYEESQAVVGDVDFAALERDETFASLRYLAKQRPKFWPFAEAALRTFDFESPANLRDDSRFAGLFLGARNDFGARTHYNVKAGVEQLTFDNAPSLDNDVLAISGFAKHQVTRRHDIEAGLSQTPIFSGFDNYGYYLSRRVSFGFAYRFRGRVRVGPLLSVGENDYEESAQPVSRLRLDEVRGLDLTISVPIDQFDWDITFGYLERESNLPGLSDEGFRVYTNLTFRSRDSRD